MTTNDHPLTESRAAELWDGVPHHVSEFDWEDMTDKEMGHALAALRAAYDAGREHERAQADPHHDPRPWQDCTREDIRKGDLVEAQIEDCLYIGVAYRQNENGGWFTEDGWYLTDGDHWPLRRIPAPTPPAEEVELPTEFGAVITDVSVVGQIDYDYAFPRLVRVVDSWFDDNEEGWTSENITAFTLPDGTRAHRDGRREDGTPRFVKVQEEEK